MNFTSLLMNPVFVLPSAIDPEIGLAWARRFSSGPKSHHGHVHQESPAGSRDRRGGPPPPSFPFSPVISVTMQSGWVETRNTTNAGRFSWLSAASRSPDEPFNRGEEVDSPALVASPVSQRSSRFEAPLFAVSTPPLRHPMSTASVRLLNKTRSLPISD